MNRGATRVSDGISNRFMELEGLRGLAAIVVAVYHFALAFYLLAYFGPRLVNPVQHLAIEPFLYANPLGGLISGTFAVAIFFVLSGFVLSIGFFQTGRVDILRKLAAKRYLRLMLPALASVLLCYTVMKIGMNHNQQAALVTGSTWLADNWSFAPHLGEAIKQATIGIFEGLVVPTTHPYNNVLWTMATEFIGSFIVFIALLLFGKSRYRWIMYTGLFIVTFNTWLLGFVIGMILADLYSRGLMAEKRRSRWTVGVVILSSIYLGGYPFDGPDLSHTVYGPISLPAFTMLHHQTLATTVAATILVVAVLSTTQLATFLRRKHLSAIGKYTFSLYLIHIPILYSLTVGLFLVFHQTLGYNKSVALAVFISIPVVWWVTVLFEKFVDAKSVMLSSYVADLYFGKRQLNLHSKAGHIMQYVSRPGAAIRARLAMRSQVAINTEVEVEAE